MLSDPSAFAKKQEEQMWQQLITIAYYCTSPVFSFLQHDPNLRVIPCPRNRTNDPKKPLKVGFSSMNHAEHLEAETLGTESFQAEVMLDISVQLLHHTWHLFLHHGGYREGTVRGMIFDYFGVLSLSIWRSRSINMIEYM